MSKNWNDLPEKLKVQCIMSMRFWTRAKLRLTSRENLELVDNQRYPFEQVGINIREGRFFSSWFSEKINPYESIDVKPEENNLKYIQFITYIMKTGIIDHFSYACVKDYPSERTAYRLLKELEKIPSFHIKQMSDGMYVTEKYLFFLKRAEPIIEKMCHMHLKEKQVDQLFNIPSFLHVKHLKLLELNSLNTAFIYIEKWISNDVPIGHKFLFSMKSVDVLAEFAKKFEKRIIHSNVDIIRISTENALKHICCGVVSRQNDVTEMLCLMIPHWFL